MTDLLSEASNSNATSLIVRDLQVLVFVYLSSIIIWQQVPDFFVINLGVTDSDCDGLVKLVACECIELRDGSWYDASVLENRVATGHSISLSRTCLPVAHYRAVIPFNN